VHFYGSHNLLTGAETVTRTTVMKAKTTALHIQRVLAANPDGPVLRIWRNPRLLTTYMTQDGWSILNVEAPE
jgi:hypothetical protein